MKRVTVCAWAAMFAGVVSAAAAAPGAGAPAGIKQVFAAAAGREGTAYAVARDALAILGNAILPLLKAEAKSTDWRRRGLAEALLLRITVPDKVAVWSRLWWWKHQLTFRDDGTVLVTFDPGEVTYYAKLGRKLPAVQSAVLDRKAVPFLLDFLRAEAGTGSGSSHTWRTGRAFQVLGHFADPRSAELLVHFGTKAYRHGSVLAKTLVKIGPPAAGALCRAAAEVSDDWHVAHRQALAAEVLAKIGHRDAAPVLIAALPKLRWPRTIITYCRAIGKLGGTKAVRVLFDELVAASRAWPGRSVHINTHPTPYGSYYNPIRKALISLGPVAMPVLTRRQAKANSLLSRAIAGGLLAELVHGKDIEKARTARAVERSVALRDGRAVITLARSAQHPMAFEAIAAFLVAPDEKKRYGHRYRDVAQVVTALAEARYPRAVELYGMMLAGRPGEHVATIVEALLIAGDPKGAAVLKRIIARRGTTRELSTEQYKAAAALAEAVLPVLQGRAEHLVTLLASDSASIRVTAARQLARKGDLRAVPVLVAAALDATGPAHATLREAVVAMGKPAIAPLDARREKADDWREKLFCEAAALRIVKPKLAAAMHAAGLVRDRGFMTRMGPTVATYGGAGKRVAAAVGPEAVPLLEAAVVWRADSVSAGIAVFALAQFVRGRSVGVLASDFNGPGWAQGQNLVAAALPAFGPEGIAAAKKVPAADPNKERFARRVTRHRAATSALAAVKDDKGVEGVLEGLKLALAGKIRSDRAAAYLSIATKYDDPRLIEPTIKVLDTFGRDVARAALPVLVRYDDERIVPVCLKVLSRSKVWASDVREAWRGLARVKGRQLVPFLAEQLAAHKDAVIRAGIARHAATLLAGTPTYLANLHKLSDEQLAGDITRLLGALRGRLDDSDRAVQVAAANTLAWYAAKCGMKEYIRPLLAWTKAHNVPVDRVMDYLVWSRDPGVGPVLLTCYRKDPLKRSNVASRLARVAHAEAIDDITAALDRRVAAGSIGYRIPEIGALAAYGKPGCEALRRVFKARSDVRFRVPAAAELCRRSYDGAFDEARKLFDRFVVGGPEKTLAAVKHADERRRRYRHFVTVLAEGMIGADRERAYAVLARAAIRTDDADLQTQLSWCLKRLRDAHPDLAKVRVPLAP